MDWSIKYAMLRYGGVLCELKMIKEFDYTGQVYISSSSVVTVDLLFSTLFQYCICKKASFLILLSN